MNIYHTIVVSLIIHTSIIVIFNGSGTNIGTPNYSPTINVTLVNTPEQSTVTTNLNKKRLITSIDNIGEMPQEFKQYLYDWQKNDDIGEGNGCQMDTPSL